ncbi:thermonuclease family protein [Rhizobium sp. C1]|uniref:thermonuclease family protein n=1 Tax=Rhizobium sp. C1 TaxID=1349799 RepID=UPI001E32556E|nr:thermonuclease family protein [Rhizobium sp. C1]MCD2179910.1 thermonuclease family protein [Rhizobium sp. C1]
MRFLFLALLVIAGILGAVILMQKGQARIVAETAPPATAAAPDKPGGSPALPSPATPPPMERLSGDPASATAPASSKPAAPQAKTETRAAAPEQPAPPANRNPEPAAPAFQVVAKPAVVAAGIMETTRGRVTLKGIVPLEPSALCGTGAAAWPCGQIAATQFRRFLRGRSLNCDISDPAWEGAVTARCMLGKEDIAAWLVDQGWARAEPGSPYEEAAGEAQAGGRGMFGPDPRRP